MISEEKLQRNTNSNKHTNKRQHTLLKCSNKNNTADNKINILARMEKWLKEPCKELAVLCFSQKQKKN